MITVIQILKISHRILTISEIILQILRKAERELDTVLFW